MAVGLALDASSRASPGLADRARHRHHPRRAPTFSDAGHEFARSKERWRSRSPPRPMRSRSSACADRRSSTRRRSRWPAFRSNRWFPRDCGFEHGYASIDDLHWDSLGNAIRASGGTNITADVPRVDLVVNGGLDLRLLGAFATGIATGGTAQADFIVSGPLRSPDSRGSHRRDQRRAASGHAAHRRVGAGGFGPRRQRVAPPPSAWPAR